METSPSYDYRYSPKKTDDSLNCRQEIASVRMLPVITWAQAGIATAYEAIPESWEERIPCVIEDPTAFAIQIRGDSMEPKYSDGDTVVVLPSIPARNGDLVVANIKDEGFAFKVLTLVDGEPYRLRLSSYNAVYQPYERPREAFLWIYPVHSVIKLIHR